MRATRRFLTTITVGAVFVPLTLLSSHPVGLIGTAGIGAWLLATGWGAAQSFNTFDDTVDISYTIGVPTTYVEATTTATLQVTRPAAAATATITISPTLPPGVNCSADHIPTIVLDAGETTGSATIPVETTVAGVFSLPSPTITLVDPLKLFTEQIQRGPEPTVTVLPQTPTVHIGKGGQPYGNAFGEHETDQPGSGIAVRELRQYVTGEDAMNIDWKSTARLGEPYVRETEGETDRQTVLLVDHRASTTIGSGDTQPIEFAREAALAMTASAVENSDPLSLWTVGNGGITNRIAAGSDPDTYNEIRSTLFALTPTSSTPTTQTRDGSLTDVTQQLPDESPFTQTLEPFLTSTSLVHPSSDADPFVDAVRRVRADIGSDAWLVLITTDAHPAGLREAISLATHGGSEVLLLIIPIVLFDGHNLDTVADTYNKYISFEDLRQQLDRHPRVTALELAPGDRLNAVLSARSESQDQRGEL